MTIRVRCSCGEHLEFPDPLAGKAVLCSACGQPVNIPSPPGPDNGDDISSDDDDGYQLQPVDHDVGVKAALLKDEPNEFRKARAHGSTWWIKKDESIVGPVSSEQLRKLAVLGLLPPTQLISRDRSTWKAAGAVEGLKFPPAGAIATADHQAWGCVRYAAPDLEYRCPVCKKACCIRVVHGSLQWTGAGSDTFSARVAANDRRVRAGKEEKAIYDWKWSYFALCTNCTAKQCMVEGCDERARRRLGHRFRIGELGSHFWRHHGLELQNDLWLCPRHANLVRVYRLMRLGVPTAIVGLLLSFGSWLGFVQLWSLAAVCVLVGIATTTAAALFRIQIGLSKKQHFVEEISVPGTGVFFADYGFTWTSNNQDAEHKQPGWPLLGGALAVAAYIAVAMYALEREGAADRQVAKSEPPPLAVPEHTGAEPAVAEARPPNASAPSFQTSELPTEAATAPDVSDVPDSSPPGEPVVPDAGAASPVPPANGPPTLVIRSASEEVLIAGMPLWIELEAADPDGDDVRIEYKPPQRDDWRPVPPSGLQIRRTVEGRISVDLRTVDSRGARSAATSRSFTVLPNPWQEWKQVEPHVALNKEVMSIGQLVGIRITNHTPKVLMRQYSNEQGQAAFCSAEDGRSIARPAGFVMRNPLVDVSSDGSRFVESTNIDKDEARVLSTRSKRMARSAKFQGVRVVRFSPNGGQVAVADTRGVHLWDLQSDDQPSSFDSPEDDIVALAFSPDGSRLLGASQTRTAVWNARDGQILHFAGAGPRLVFHPDGDRFLGGDDTSLHLSRSSDGAELHAIDSGLCMVAAFTPNGHFYAAQDGERLLVRETRSGQVVHELPLPERNVILAAFNSTGTALAVAGIRAVWIWAGPEATFPGP